MIILKWRAILVSETRLRLDLEAEDPIIKAQHHAVRVAIVVLVLRLDLVPLEPLQLGAPYVFYNRSLNPDQDLVCTFGANPTNLTLIK